MLRCIACSIASHVAYRLVCLSVCLYVYVYVSLCVCVCVSMPEGSLVSEFMSSNNSSVKCLAYSPSDNSVYIVLSSGHMVVCNGAVTSSRSPVRTECHGNGRPIHCIAVRSLDTGFVVVFSLLFSCRRCIFCHCASCSANYGLFVPWIILTNNPREVSGSLAARSSFEI